jgi:hypothetical protein
MAARISAAGKGKELSSHPLGSPVELEVILEVKP